MGGQCDVVVDDVQVVGSGVMVGGQWCVIGWRAAEAG